MLLPKRQPKRPRSLATAALLRLFLAVFAVSTASLDNASAKKSLTAAGQEKLTASPAAEQEAAAPSGDYVGTEACIACHDDQQRRFNNTVMGKIFAHPRTPLEARGCEACHGPGRGHVEAGGSKDSMPIRFGKDSQNTIEEQNSVCLDCHQRGNRLFWQGSPHESRALACVDCHQVKQVVVRSVSSESRYEAPLTENKGTLKPQPELCLGCHQMRRAQLQRSSHMPFREGKVTCTSCHNPHGSPNPKQLIQATSNENCLSCHTERRGPFLWEHPAVAENCMSCHEAHGSSNAQLLRVRMPRVCETCHVASRHPSTPQPLNSVRNFNRACTNCHVTIHGSNHPSGNYFLR